MSILLGVGGRKPWRSCLVFSVTLLKLSISYSHGSFDQWKSSRNGNQWKYADIRLSLYEAQHILLINNQDSNATSNEKHAGSLLLYSLRVRSSLRLRLNVNHFYIPASYSFHADFTFVSFLHHGDANLMISSLYTMETGPDIPQTSRTIALVPKISQLYALTIHEIEFNDRNKKSKFPF